MSDPRKTEKPQYIRVDAPLWQTFAVVAFGYGLTILLLWLLGALQ